MNNAQIGEASSARGLGCAEMRRESRLLGELAVAPVPSAELEPAQKGASIPDSTGFAHLD